MTEIDHLVLVVPDLDAAIDRFDAELGVRPVIGGQHPGMGTWNALVALEFGGDRRCYLELIAADPTQPTPTGPRPFGIDDDPGPRVATFAVRPADGETLDDVCAAMRSAGHDPGPAVAMSRTTPDGVELHWRLTFPSDGGDGLVPFVIDWGDTPNPAATVTASATLAWVRGGPTPAAQRILEAIRPGGLDVSVLDRSPLSAEIRNGDRSIVL